MRLGGSNEPTTAERDPRGKNQPLKPLLLVERRLDPHVRRARENALSERQESVNVGFLQLL